ncbi:MAG TPA: hypothetical protein VLM40_03265 [Gemmata sp.]|nr:hypothetical protein [Gemmata sp.]
MNWLAYLAYGCIAAAFVVWLWFDWKGLRDRSWTLRAIADILAATFLLAAVGLLVFAKVR